MIGRLPTTLTVDGKDYDIRTDYRDCLTVITAFNDSMPTSIISSVGSFVVILCIHSPGDERIFTIILSPGLTAGGLF